MADIITQDQINVCLQTIRNQYIKMEILNSQNYVIDEVSGNCIDGNISIDANADIRRTCSISFVITKNTIKLDLSREKWLNRFIRIYIGIEHNITKEIIWFNYGIFLIDAPTWDYNATTNTISFQGLDLTSKLTGLRNGYIEGVTTIIPQNSSVRNSMINTIKYLGDFEKYAIEDCKLKNGDIQNTPYEISIEQGGTVWDIITALRDILPRYQVYFDVNGIFHYNQIPTGENNEIIVNDVIFKQVLLNESVSVDFSYVKNYIEVYGAQIEGQGQAYAIAFDDNPDSPYNIDGENGIIRAVYCGGEYANITTDELAQERANYELWLHTRMEDNITLEMVPLHYLDVNTLIAHATRDKEEQEQYLIKSINVNLAPNGTMTINAIKYYPLYPDI